MESDQEPLDSVPSTCSSCSYYSLAPESNDIHLLESVDDTKQTLFHERILDDNFTVFEYLADEDHPNFIEEVLRVFLEVLPKLIDRLSRSRDCDDCRELLNKMKSMSNRIGAVSIKKDADKLSSQCHPRKSFKRWKSSLKSLQVDHERFKEGIELYLEDLKEAKLYNLQVPTPLDEQIDAKRRSFFDEGFLDQKFIEIENLRDMNDAEDFLEETFAMFFEYSGALITSIEKKLHGTIANYGQILYILDQLKGISASNGSIKINNTANEMEKFCREQSLESAKKSFKQLKADYDIFKPKFMSFLEFLSIAKRVAKIKKDIQRDSPMEWLHFTS